MITITLAPCPGVDKPFASVTKETVVFSGVEVPDGLQVALFDGSGTCLAIGDVAGGKVELDLDTQEAVDATEPVGPGEAVSVWLVVGDKDTHIATVPCKLIRNLIDDEATHPHVPAERYPTVSELNAWLEAAGEVREGVCTCAKAAASSAEAAASSAETAARQAEGAAASAKAASGYASDASDASISAAKSYENAEASRKAADSAAQVAREARENAQLQQQQATAAAGNANGYRQQAQNAQRLAERAQEKAEAAQEAAEERRKLAEEAERDAAQSAQEAGAKADEANQAAADAGSANSAAQSAKTAAEQAKVDAEAAKAGAETAKASAEAKAQEAATSATKAATSATNAAQSATAAQEAAQGLQASAERIGYGFLRPGSPLVVVGGDSTCFTLVKLVDDMAASYAPCLISRIQEGDYWFAMAYTKNAEKNAYHCYILNDNLVPEWEFWHPRGNGRILPYCVIVEGSAYIRTENTLDRFTLNDDGTGTLVKTININLRGVYCGICQPQIAYNPKSGHILVADGSIYFIDHWDHYDLELNALGTSTAGDAGTWFTLNGWSYFVDDTTLYRALADDTLEEVVAGDGTQLRWGTKVDGVNTATWRKPGIFYDNPLKLHDGVRSFALSYGDEDEIVLGPKKMENAATTVTNCSGGITRNFVAVTSVLYPQIRVAENRNSLSNGYKPAIFQGSHYNAYGDVRPMLFGDSENKTFDVMFNGAVMIRKYPESYGG